MLVSPPGEHQPGVHDLVKEAQDCRRHALELANRPEGPFLLRLADVFDELAREKSARSS